MIAEFSCHDITIEEHDQFNVVLLGVQCSIVKSRRLYRCIPFDTDIPDARYVPNVVQNQVVQTPRKNFSTLSL